MDRDGRTPLHHLRCAIRALASGGADIDAPSRNATRESPLHRAACNDDVAAACELLEGGAAADAATADGESPLHKAAHPGFRKLGSVAEVLISVGAEVDG